MRSQHPLQNYYQNMPVDANHSAQIKRYFTELFQSSFIRKYPFNAINETTNL